MKNIARIILMLILIILYSSCSRADNYPVETEVSESIDNHTKATNTTTVTTSTESSMSETSAMVETSIDGEEFENVVDGMGNTNGNLNNLGIAAIKDSVIYYYRELPAHKKGSLAKVDIRTNDMSLLTDHSASFINLSGDWIIYCNFREADHPEGIRGPIYKIKIDGSGREKLTDEVANHMCVYNG